MIEIGKISWGFFLFAPTVSNKSWVWMVCVYVWVGGCVNERIAVSLTSIIWFWLNFLSQYSPEMCKTQRAAPQMTCPVDVPPCFLFVETIFKFIILFSSHIWHSQTLEIMSCTSSPFRVPPPVCALYECVHTFTCIFCSKFCPWLCISVWECEQWPVCVYMLPWLDIVLFLQS